MGIRQFKPVSAATRFRSVSDRRFGGRGWYIDDVRIYSCAIDEDLP